jgi:hypothetical protein
MLIAAEHGYSVDPDAGLVYGRQGRPVGSVRKSGYVFLNVGHGEDGKSFAAHRVMWAAVNGPIPDGLVIDHINGVRSDNRISNLRAVTESVNCQNRRTAKGASLHRCGKWQAYLTINGRGVYLGLYETEGEARAVYLAEKRKHHEGCTL